jgi:hypothetical protein
MKLLFVENRYKTDFWEIIGKFYQEMGHEIFWIVQNPLFQPTIGDIKVLKFPRKVNIKKNYTNTIKKIIQSNRGINYFGLESDDFIFWYHQEIEKIIEDIQPDLAFGEATLFHELLVIDACKKRSIKYLNPSSCRYPSGRFSFYLYDSLVPFGISGDKFSVMDANMYIDSIQKFKSQPDYMKTFELTLKDNLKDKLKIIYGYLIGERYNTPSPFKKLLLNHQRANNFKLWEKNAKNMESLKGSFFILFPLQMQPEANIDVWGHPFNNQVSIISWIIDQLKDGEKLVIKPNPKSYYEISENLIKIIQNNSDKIIPLKHSVKMDELLPDIDLVVTVTGTIALECIFNNKPIVSFGQISHYGQLNNINIDLNSSLEEIIIQIKSNNFPRISEDKKVDFFQNLVNTSFMGVNGDGLHNKHYLNDDNLILLKNAFEKILDFEK